MTGRRAAAALLVVALVGLAGCSSAPPHAPQTAVRDECIFLRSLDSWQALDDWSLVVWTAAGRTPYLVTLLRPAPSLRSAFTIGFEDANGDGMICSYGRDALLLDDPVVGSATISSIRPLSEAQLEDVLASHRDSKGERRSR